MMYPSTLPALHREFIEQALPKLAKDPRIIGFAKKIKIYCCYPGKTTLSAAKLYLRMQNKTLDIRTDAQILAMDILSNLISKAINQSYILCLSHLFKKQEAYKSS